MQQRRDTADVIVIRMRQDQKIKSFLRRNDFFADMPELSCETPWSRIDKYVPTGSEMKPDTLSFANVVTIYF